MIKNDLVSIIIPVYNSERHIKKTINSLLHQTYESFEIIVVDDCSTDRTKFQLIDFIDENKIIYKELEKNSGGPAEPRNLGIELAKGKWIAFCDSDDLWHPNKLSIQISWMHKNNCDFSCTMKKDFSDEKNLNFNTFHKHSILRISYNLLLCKDFIPTSSVLIDRKLIANHRFNELRRLVSVEDYLFWLDILKTQKITCNRINQELMFYRISEEQISKNKLKRIPQFITMFSTHFSDKPYVLRKFYALIFTTSHYTISLLQKIKI
jgi:teichuronic acid biosynthesis glycosyltransferase TuaG